tara:strand:+ start:624 stop:1565 length:942 start_codon:yes stop_codon:yes gene_type:complete
MMDDSYIRKYCLDKFSSNYRLESDGRQMVVPSIFINNDYKRHMSINVENGLWRCFKTGETGNFIRLYVLMEKCSYAEAKVNLAFEQFNEGRKIRKPIRFDTNKIKSNIEGAKDFEFVEGHPFAKKRMVPDAKFMLAKHGPYKGRLIIPFINRKGRLFYFQARALGDEMPKYLNCKDLKSSQVLYPYDYSSYEPLYVTEGVFDCLSLQQIGLNATTTLSCYTSREQMLQLSQYQGSLVCAFDSDEAGQKGRDKFLQLSNWVCRDNIQTVTPPNGFKDWNELLIREGPDYLKQAAEKTIPLNSLECLLSSPDNKS